MGIGTGREHPLSEAMAGRTEGSHREALERTGYFNRFNGKISLIS